MGLYDVRRGVGHSSLYAIPDYRCAGFVAAVNGVWVWGMGGACGEIDIDLICITVVIDD